MKKPKEVRNPSEKRSLESLKIDYNRFVADGSNLKRAKEFNNVIDEPLFNVPLDQVFILKFL